MGQTVGDHDGCGVTSKVGAKEGTKVGAKVGENVGTNVGGAVAPLTGRVVGGGAEDGVEGGGGEDGCWPMDHRGCKKCGWISIKRGDGHCCCNRNRCNIEEHPVPKQMTRPTCNVIVDFR